MACNDMRERGKYTDFVLKSASTGTEYPVHKLVLATTSRYLDGMLSAGMKEAQTGIWTFDTPDKVGSYHGSRLRPEELSFTFF